MVIQHITLGNFLLLFAQKNSHYARFNHINTDNSSFPQKYRRTFQHVAGFWRELYENNETELLNKEIDYIVLLPNGIDIEKDIEFHILLDIDNGFIKQTEDGLQPLSPVIYVVLKLDNHNDQLR